MNLEQIDTSTTAGKAEVMRLAAEGRRVAQRTFPNEAWIEQRSPAWAWPAVDYAIIAEPDEVWVAFFGSADGGIAYYEEGVALNAIPKPIRYIRADLADLAGEVKP